MIPVTILTGFLGSGKTTLLKRILNEKHGMKIAVIENEFGEENIDNEILVQETNEQIIQMSNGCICCTIRGDLARALEDLADRKKAGTLDFDRVVIETTGVANPGPVAQTFFMDNSIADSFCSTRSSRWSTRSTPIINSTNTRSCSGRWVSRTGCSSRSPTSSTLTRSIRSEHRLVHMNPRAAIKVVNFGDADIKEIFDLRGFNLNTKLEIDPDFLAEDDHESRARPRPRTRRRSRPRDLRPRHSHDHAHHHHAHHDDKIKSFVYRSERPFDPNRSKTSSAASCRSTASACFATRACSI